MQRDEFTGEAAQSAGLPVEDFDCIELFELRRIIDVMVRSLREINDVINDFPGIMPVLFYACCPRIDIPLQRIQVSHVRVR